MLRRLVLEEIAESAKSQHDESLWMLSITDEPQHGLNICRTCIASSIGLVRRRVKQIDPIEIHAGERLIDGEVEQLVDYFELLWADFCAMVVLSGGEYLTQ